MTTQRDYSGTRSEKMTDADPRSNGFPPRAEFAAPETPALVNSAVADASPHLPTRVPEFHETAEKGEPGYGSPAQPGSGGASAWPAWPGVARPAGWFLSVPREAAPLGTTDTEPARPDNQSADDDLPVPPVPTAPVPAPAWLPQAPRAQESPSPRDDQPGGDWPEYDQLAGDDTQGWTARPRYPRATARRVPVVGPTEALRGRAGGPGFRVPAGYGFGVQDPANRSGWQIADELWRDSGITWDSAD